MHDEKGVEERMESALSMHDTLLLNAPEGASHDSDLCPFCLDWAMTDDGLPNGTGRFDFADAKKPYGPVKYADPGYQTDGVHRYPVDTETHAQAAWSYIHQATNAEKYSADHLASIRTAIQTALKQFGVEADNKEVEKTKKLADAKSGSQKPKNASADQKASDADRQAEAVASEGGTSPMETITQETHEALLEKALRDATASLEAENAQFVAQVAELTEAADAVAAEVASLKADNERLNGELDTAQVELKSAQDESTALKAEIAAAADAAAKAEVATERASQVRNLSLFTEDYIADKASRWADMDETAWNERVDEWKAAHGHTATAAPTNADVASAMTGSNEGQQGTETSARRRALGLA